MLATRVIQLGDKAGSRLHIVSEPKRYAEARARAIHAESDLMTLSSLIRVLEHDFGRGGSALMTGFAHRTILLLDQRLPKLDHAITVPYRYTIYDLLGEQQVQVPARGKLRVVLRRGDGPVTAEFDVNVPNGRLIVSAANDLNSLASSAYLVPYDGEDA